MGLERLDLGEVWGWGWNVHRCTGVRFGVGLECAQVHCGSGAIGCG